MESCNKQLYGFIKKKKKTVTQTQWQDKT